MLINTALKLGFKTEINSERGKWHQTYMIFDS